MSDEESSSASDVDYIPSGKKKTEKKNSYLFFFISLFSASLCLASRRFSFAFECWRDLGMRFALVGFFSFYKLKNRHVLSFILLFLYRSFFLSINKIGIYLSPKPTYPVNIVFVKYPQPLVVYWRILLCFFYFYNHRHKVKLKQKNTIVQQQKTSFLSPQKHIFIFKSRFINNRWSVLFSFYEICLHIVF